MPIKISNYDTALAKNSLKASFDLTIPEWGEVTYAGCKHFRKDDGKEWIVLPEKSVKNADGTWGQAIKLVAYPDATMKQLQKSALEEIAKQSAQAPANELPF